MSMTNKTAMEVLKALENLTVATCGIDAPHVKHAREVAEKALDKVAGFEPRKWKELVALIHYSGEKRETISPADRRSLDAIAWRLQDGYGVAGYTPVQGWDWSGIRDSSRTAKATMIRAAEDLLGRTL